MTRSEFYDFVEEKTTNLLDLLKKKAEEYAKSESAFHNFIEGYHMSTSKSEEEYAWNLRVKHLQSIKDMLISGEYDKKLVEEKFGDDLAYNLLIWCMISQKMDNKPL